MQKGTAKGEKKIEWQRKNMRTACISDFKFNTRFYNILMKVDLNVAKENQS